jgi:very-short-patch-repair endonuclease
MDPGYPNDCVRLLRAYLEYVASGGHRLDSASVTTEPLNEFEQSVCDELTRRGMKVIGQLGTSRYRIDLVILHPEHPGRYVLAIECDGATYHSGPTARDRDRLRQQQLEALGWRFHRIWSTDWFLRRSDEIERVMHAYQQAVRQADDDDDGSAAAAGMPGQSPTALCESVYPIPLSATPVSRTRGQKPWFPNGQSVDQYSRSQLAQMVRWVESDGCLRTDEEIVTEVVQALGFKRRGNRIVAAIKAAIPYARR